MTSHDLGQSIPTRANWAEEAVAAHSGAEHLTREEQVLARIAKARARKARIKEERITLSHGAGGKATQTLIEAVFLDAFRNPVLEQLEDGAQLATAAGRLAFTTDSYVVSPLFFPGGDIGDLAVNGTVNDLAMCGARPLYLSCGFILEEGFPVADLQRIVASMAAAAQRAGVQIVTGDTKVVERGKADGCYVNTAGVGLLEREIVLSAAAARPGDKVLVSGPIGDHGITVMLARGELDIEADIVSDTAPLHEITAALLDATGDGVRLLRDATRGGVATICNEVAVALAGGRGARRGRAAGAPGRQRRVRAAGDRPAVRGVRGQARRGGRARTCGRRAGRAALPHARRRRRRDRHRRGRPAGARAAAHRVRRHAHRGPAGGRSAPPDLLTVHELSITQSVVTAVTQRLRDAQVRRIRLEVGQLSGLVPDAVRFCFEMVATGTTCEGAALEIDEPPGLARCRTCGADFETGEVLPLCECGSADVEVRGGRELRIREVEVGSVPPVESPPRISAAQYTHRTSDGGH